jgi:Cu-processing system permease protein
MRRKQSFQTIGIIARLTFREAVRKRIVLASLLLGIAFLVIFSLGFYFIRGEIESDMANKFSAPEVARQQGYNMLVMAGMYVVNFLSIATAALLTADSLAGEIQSGTIQAVVTKPIRRMAVVLGKWLGYAALLLLYMLLMGGGVMLSVWAQARYLPPNPALGLGMLYFNSLIIMSLTLAFSSAFSTLATGGAVFGAFGLAFIGGWVERIGSILKNETAVNLGVISSLILPSEALWNKAAALMTSPLMTTMGITPFFTAGSEPSALMLVYAGLYLLLVVGLAVRRLGGREL